jgi:hypothetical protein
MYIFRYIIYSVVVHVIYMITISFGIKISVEKKAAARRQRFVQSPSLQRVLPNERPHPCPPIYREGGQQQGRLQAPGRRLFDLFSLTDDGEACIG